MNMGRSVKFEREILNLAVVVYVFQTTQNLVITRYCFVQYGEKMYHKL